MDAWILATLLVYFWGNSVGASEPKASKVVCPTYLTEGDDLNCECHPTSPENTCKTYWLGRPDGPRLHKPKVTRDDNGTRFTCETDCSGQKSSTDYTLQVAYGPSEVRVSVQGPPSFLADGDQTMTLTCVPYDVNPAPSFKWRNNAGLQCENGDTEKACVLRPQYFYDGKIFSCRVTNVQTDTVVTADFTVHLTFSSAAGGDGLQGQHTGAGTGSIGLIIGVIAGLIVIAIAVFVLAFWRRNRRPKYDDHDVKCTQSLNKVAFLPLPPPIAKDDTSSDTTQPEDVETDFGYSTLPGSRESIPLSSAKSVSKREVEEPAGMSLDYSTVLDEIKGGVTTPVKVMSQDTSNGYTEVQLNTPPAGLEPPNPAVNLLDVVNISQLDLPKPYCRAKPHVQH